MPLWPHAAAAQRTPAGCASWTGGGEAGDSDRGGGVMVEKTVPLCATPPALSNHEVCVCVR